MSSKMYIDMSAETFDITTIENLDANILRKIIQMMHKEHTREVEELHKHNEQLSEQLRFEKLFNNQEMARINRTKNDATWRCVTLECENKTLNERIESYLEIQRVLRCRLKSQTQEIRTHQEEIECLHATISHHKEKFAYVDRTCTTQWLERVKFLSNEISKEQQKHVLLKENSDYVISILTQQLETQQRKSQKTISELTTKIETLQIQENQATQEKAQKLTFKFNINAKPFIPSNPKP